MGNSLDITDQSLDQLIAIFGINSISIINRPYNAVQFFPSDTRLQFELCHKLKNLFKMNHIWIIIFNELCAAIFINEATLRKLNYFDGFIRNKTNLKDNNNYYQIPNGAHIYEISLKKEPFSQILYYSTFTSIETTFLQLNRIPLNQLPNISSELDMHLIEAFNGITNIEIQTDSI